MLLRYDCSAGQKQTALKRAVHDGAFEICKLLVEAGAKAGDLDTDDLPCYFRRDLIQLLVDHGLDLSKDRALANLLVDRRIKPLLGLYLRNKERFPDWEEQAAMALCEFVSLENLKWVSLMIWAGADPLKKVQDLCECSIDEGVDFRQSAAEIAITSRKPKI
ncbi:MAG TPA: hypothetical protein PLA50_03205, partial [Bacteroidia bacterium]|nr:hypothetical protein [Bacteroidia bacterium]